ncbi:MAG: glycosyltransferase family 39 protein [Pegethrix bostrychoides GSE-TBD4-15B]|uniref:Glycosyltransferase family 39 protein n=1 Tax=Pegethrix bostrychoides GSE-TBD4-15B TaxID=2839662 RepID=A0A951PCJ5_9CYAN|nr:glycosyltransferase family 39 protein [Pegethrix bostrychoides GSE-TBD4-15B]
MTYSKPFSAQRIDQLWTLGFTAAALLLLTVNLGLPLKDWDEGLVAQVAREIYQAPAGSFTWLFPTLWGEPYFNKPPLLHGLIAMLYGLAGVHEWTARLPSAGLTLASVPLLYRLSRELFHQRLPAIFATLVYLTSLPVIRNGRFAMLDGAILCFLLLLFWALLRSRRDYRWLLGVGGAFGLLCLTKGILVGLLLGGIALAFLAWDTPRLLRQPYLWLGLGLGLVPVAGWYGAQWLHYGTDFLGNNLVEQSLARVWTDVEENGAPLWYYLLELLKYGAPWVLWLPGALKLAWSHRNLSWAKLGLVWAAGYFGAISLMATKLPWYILPLFPALALLLGAHLAELWQQGRQVGIVTHPAKPYSRIWIGALGLLGLGGWAGAAYFMGWATPAEANLWPILMVAGATLMAAAGLAARQNPQFIVVLGWGTFLAMLLLMFSPHWAWELAESYPVRPVAALVQQVSEAKLYTSYPYNRPSLNFYSQRQVMPASSKQLRRSWRKGEPLLIDRPTAVELGVLPAQIIGEAETWLLVRAKI